MSSKSISKSVVWQLLGKILLQGIAFFTMPIFTRILSPEDYGITSLFNTWCSISALLYLSGSLQNALNRFGEDKLKEYISSVASVSIISSIVCLLFVFIFNRSISSFTGLSPSLVFLVIIHSFFSYFISMKISEYDTLKEVEKSTFLSVLQSVSTVALSLLFVILAKNNKAEAKVYGQTIPVVIMGLVCFIIIYAQGKRIWNTKYIKFCFALGLPLVFHSIGHLLFAQTDKIMIQKFISTEYLGIYSVAVSLSSVLPIIFGAINVAWVPFYYEYKKNNDNKSILEHTKRYVKLMSLIFIGFILLAYDVFKLMAPPEYAEGMDIVPYFVIGHYFSYLYLFPVNYEFYNEKTAIIPFGTLGSALINILINYLLIPRFGIVGAAIGTCAAHFVLFLFHWVIARFILKKNFEYHFSFFVKWTFVVVLSVILVVLIKKLVIVRWIIAGCLGIYILRDIIKNKSIF